MWIPADVLAYYVHFPSLPSVISPAESSDRGDYPPVSGSRDSEPFLSPTHVDDSCSNSQCVFLNPIKNNERFILIILINVLKK